MRKTKLFFLFFSFFLGIALFLFSKTGNQVKADSPNNMVVIGSTSSFTPTPTIVGQTNPTITPTLIPTLVPTVTPTADSVPPVVDITYPLDGSKVKKGTSVVINASVTDNVGILKIDFFVNDVLYSCTDSSVLYQCSWNVPKKTGVKYTIKATAYDLAGNFSSDSVVVTSR